MPLDRYLIDHCSPTLANLKTANLFSCRYSSQEQLAAQVLGWHRALEPKGVCLRLLRAKSGCALIYVYRPQRLACDLCKPGVPEFLAREGYTNLSPDAALEHLSQRLCTQDAFPHEIGLFLSYPLGDVQGFIDNGGAHYKCSGCWKVYCNECETAKLFAKYQKCRGVYWRLFSGGRSILQLTVAA